MPQWAVQWVVGGVGGVVACSPEGLQLVALGVAAGAWMQQLVAQVQLQLILAGRSLHVTLLASAAARALGVKAAALSAAAARPPRSASRRRQRSMQQQLQLQQLLQGAPLVRTAGPLPPHTFKWTRKQSRRASCTLRMAARGARGAAACA